jgi:hypothetical protein
VIKKGMRTISKKKMIFFTLVILTALKISAQELGSVKGKIIEQATKQPIQGATITIREKQFTAITDSAGIFSIHDVPVGNYSVVVTSIGYQQKTINDITVFSNKTYYIETELLEDARKLGEVVVSVFKGENNPKVPVSSYSLSREEIFRSPGSQGDIFRAISTLPGVVSSGGQYSAIAVRGQGTSDNVYMSDDIPLFQVTHLEIEGFNSGFNDPNGGRFSIFAPRVIDNAFFQGGGFAAEFGRKSASLLELNIKEGNRETPYISGQFDLLGATLIYDGPSGIDKKTSLFATARYQNFALLEQLIGLTSQGTPSYGDYMIKTSTEINAQNKLTFIAMFNPEKFERTIDDFSKTGSLNDNNNSNFVGDSKTNKSVFGLNLRTLLSKNAYLKNVLYYRTLHIDNDLGYAYPLVDENGNLVSKDNIPYEPDLRHIRNDQGELGYRSVFSEHFKKLSLTAGVDLARVDLDYSRTLKHTDTLYTFYPNDIRPAPDQYYLILQPAEFNSNFKDFAYNVSGYLDLSFILFNRLTLNPGLRYDYTGFTTENTLAPRISGSLSINDKHSINFAAGIYFQDPEYSDVASQPQGHKLKNARTIQYILGYKYYFSPDLKLTAEGWYKQFDDLTVQPSSGQSLLNSNGTGYAYGGDISLTKRLSRKYYGQVSYSYMLSKRDDSNGLGKYDYIFSQPNTISLLASYKPNDKWIFSGKFRYSTGRPTDKYIVHSDVLKNPSYLRYSQEIVSKNGDRLNDFISLDLRADYSIRSKKATWTIFVDIVDAQNRFNQSEEVFQPLTGKTYALGLAIFPTFGLRVDL